MHAIKTHLRGNFPGHVPQEVKPAPVKAKRPPVPVNVAALEIRDDPLPTSRQITDLKYDAIFRAMKPGQCIKCETSAVGLLQGALRKHIERNKMADHIVRTVLNYEGTGTGRVWLMYVGKDAK